MITFRKIEKKEVKFHVEYIEDYDSDLIVSVIVTAQWDIFEGNASYNELEYETQDDFLKSKDYELLKEQSFIDLSHKIQKGFDLLIARSNIMQLINYTIPFEITYEEQQQKGLEKYAQSHNINLPKVSDDGSERMTETIDKEMAEELSKKLEIGENFLNNVDEENIERYNNDNTGNNSFIDNVEDGEIKNKINSSKISKEDALRQMINPSSQNKIQNLENKDDLMKAAAVAKAAVKSGKKTKLNEVKEVSRNDPFTNIRQTGSLIVSSVGSNLNKEALNKAIRDAHNIILRNLIKPVNYNNPPKILIKGESSLAAHLYLDREKKNERNDLEKFAKMMERANELSERARTFLIDFAPRAIQVKEVD